VTAFARAFEAAATGKPLPVERGNETGAGGLPLTPVESAPTLTSDVGFAPSAPRRGPRRLALLGALAIMVGGGVWFVRGPLRRPTPGGPPAAAAPTASPAPAAPGRPIVDPLPPEPAAATTAGDAPAAADGDEPATDTDTDDTDSKPPKASKKAGVRRRPGRRAAGAKPAVTTDSPTTAPVNRKLINQL
jgi:hypothetical protein